MASGDITGLKQKILAGFSQIFSFRKNSRVFIIFLSFPPKIVRDCPQSFGQIAENLRIFREKLLLPNQQNRNEMLRTSYNKG
jgi:hypothetical protein